MAGGQPAPDGLLNMLVRLCLPSIGERYDKWKSINAEYDGEGAFGQ
jgi:hypothetical protein